MGVTRRISRIALGEIRRCRRMATTSLQIPVRRSRFLRISATLTLSVEAIRSLAALGVDPHAHEFVLQVARRRRVRAVVAGVVEHWYAATTAGARRRVDHQSPEFLAQAFRGLIGSRPVYYLWERKPKSVA